MNILEKIVATKKQEIAFSKSKNPISNLEKSDFFDRQTVSLKSNILKPESTGIIAEFKRKSPSKGIINDSVNVENVVVFNVNSKMIINFLKQKVGVLM